MIARSSSLPRGLLAKIVAVLLIAPPVWAQQPPDAPAAPPAAAGASQPAPSMQPVPTTVPGRPDIPNAEVASKLRNVAAPPIPPSADKLPVAQLKLPPGF